MYSFIIAQLEGVLRFLRCFVLLCLALPCFALLCMQDIDYTKYFTNTETNKPVPVLNKGRGSMRMNLNKGSVKASMFAFI